MKKIKKNIEHAWHALTIASGTDVEWDEYCDNKFLKFLDKVYYVTLFLIFAYPASAMVVLLVQNYGK